MDSNLFIKAIEINKNLEKSAAKSKMPRRGVSKALEKARAQYSAQKKRHDQIAKEHGKLSNDLNEAKDQMLKTRKHLSRLTEAQRMADIADASGVIFHPDSDDISYIVDGKECHLELDDIGDIKAMPWRDFQKSKKNSLQSNITEPNPSADPPDPDIDNQDESMANDVKITSDDGWSWDEADVDDLYSELAI